MRVFLCRLFPLLLVIAESLLSEPECGWRPVRRARWLSDESCAGGRASSGRTLVQSGCAKKCVHEGKKIVLVDPDHKRLLTISEPGCCERAGGRLCEINGDLDETCPVAAPLIR